MNLRPRSQPRKGSDGSKLQRGVSYQVPGDAGVIGKVIPVSRSRDLRSDTEYAACNVCMSKQKFHAI